MDMTLQLSRTVKGQDEIFNLGHALRPRQRQILFSVGNGVSFAELCKKMPHCAELEAMVNDLLQSGFIQALRNMAASSQPTPAASRSPASPAQSAANLESTRLYALEFLAALVGTKSPAYRKMGEAQGLASFNAVLPTCYKVIAAVASPRQAAEMEAEIARRMAA